MTRGQRIKFRREQLNISQTDLARRINVSKQTLYKYENDIITNIPSDKIEELAKILDVPIPYIFSRDDIGIDYLIEPSHEDKAKELFEKFESLPPEKQAAFLNYLEFLQSGS